MTVIWWYYYIMTYFPSLLFWIGWWTPDQTIWKFGGSEWFLLVGIKLCAWNCQKNKRKKERKKKQKQHQLHLNTRILCKETTNTRYHRISLDSIYRKCLKKRKVNKHDSRAIIRTIYHLLFEACWGMLALCCFYTNQQRSVRLPKSRANVFQ